MGEKERINFAQRDSRLAQADHGTAPAIKQQFLHTRFHENSRAKSLRIRKWRSRTEKRHFDHARGAALNDIRRPFRSRVPTLKRRSSA